MDKPQLLSLLFQKQPPHWNLRGDPWLWRDLMQRIDAARQPVTADEFAAWLESEFELLTGVPLSHADVVYLEKYNHGGMSGGYLKPAFWRDTVIPFLKKQFEEQYPC